MTSQEFTLWLRGFTEGVHEYNVTPKQWDLLKEKLAEVNDEPNKISGFIYSTNGAPNWYSTTIANDKDLLHD